MAWLSIPEAEVTRVFYNGLGAGLKETFTKRDGEISAKYYTAFFKEPHGLSEGDIGKFGGIHSAKLNEYEKDGEIRTNVEVTLNDTRYEPVDDF